jgi:hypothetical protein
VRDHRSGEIGSASQFLEVLDLSRREVALSGIMMSDENGIVSATPQRTIAPSVPEHAAGFDPAVRAFPHGSAIRFGYQMILDARANPQNQQQVTLQTRLFHKRRPSLQPRLYFLLRLGWVVLGLTAGFTGSRLAKRRRKVILPDTLPGVAGAGR